MQHNPIIESKDDTTHWLRVIILLLLVNLSSDALKITVVQSVHNLGIFYFSSMVLLLFIPFLFVKGIDRPSRSLSVVMYAFSAWWIIRYFTTDYTQELFALLPLLNVMAGIFSFLFIAPLIYKYRLSEFTQWSFLGIATIVGLIGIGHAALTGLSDMGEVSILTANHAHIGLYMLMAFGIASWNWDDCKSQTGKWFLVFVGLIAFISIMLSGSRAAIMGFGFLALAWLLGKGTPFIVRAITIGLIVVGGIAFLDQMSARAVASSSIEMGEDVKVDTSLGYRFFMWYGMFQVIFTHGNVFWIGLGYETLVDNFNKLVYFPVYVNGAHNVYIHTWVEMGLIGLLLFIVPHLLVLAKIWKSKVKSARFAVATIFAVLTTGFVQETLYGNISMGNFNTLYWLIIGLWLATAQSNVKTT